MKLSTYTFLNILLFLISTFMDAQELPPIENYAPEVYGAENQNWAISQTKEKFDLNSIENPILAERYGKAMINDFNNGTVAWTDWNILLNETGGPNHVGNYCSAQVHGNTQTGKLILTNSYNYIGHFSKFISPGAKRISTGTTANYLSATSFINTDGSIVVVALNDSDNAIDYMLTIDQKTATLSMPARAIQTIVLN